MGSGRVQYCASRSLRPTAGQGEHADGQAGRKPGAEHGQIPRINDRNDGAEPEDLELLAVKSNGEPNGEEGSAGENHSRSAGVVRRRGRRFGYRRTQGARPGRPRLAEPNEGAGTGAENRSGDVVEPSAEGGTTPL